jgi:hypothetical protein
VCSSGGCVRPDTSFLFHALARVHFAGRWSVGAGAHFALFPTAHPPLSDEAEAAGRQLSRSYVALAAHALYYPFNTYEPSAHAHRFMPYLGAELGFALLSDRYRSPSIDEEGALRIGEPGMIVRSEGLLSCLLLGADFGISKPFVVGFAVQAGSLWFPEQPETSLHDPATVRGLEFLVSGAFHLKAYIDL